MRIFIKITLLKQWGIHPKNLNKSIVGRLPYTDPLESKTKIMPKNGYTKLFENMTKDKKIEILLNTSYEKLKKR